MRSRYVLVPAVVVMAVMAGSAGPAPSGAIEGSVTYSGTLPKMKPIDMSKEPACAKEHTSPALTQTAVGARPMPFNTWLCTSRLGSRDLPFQASLPDSIRRAARMSRTFSPCRQARSSKFTTMTRYPITFTHGPT
jgi:hypothetical protein